MPTANFLPLAKLNSCQCLSLEAFTLQPLLSYLSLLVFHLFVEIPVLVRHAIPPPFLLSTSLFVQKNSKPYITTPLSYVCFNS